MTTALTRDRILIVDDHDFPTIPIANALGPIVDWCPTVVELEREIRKGKRWSAAFVDFFLGEGEPCGLSAMAVLRDAFPSIRLASFTTFGDGGGRMLFLAAAHHWYDAVFLNKANLAPPIIERAANPNEDPTDPRLWKRLRKSAVVDQLFEQPSWLQMWQAWPQLDGSPGAVAARLGYKLGVVRGFASRAVQAIDAFESAFGESDQITKPERGNRAQAAPLARFAGDNRTFFSAPGLDRVLTHARPWNHRH